MHRGSLLLSALLVSLFMATPAKAQQRDDEAFQTTASGELQSPGPDKWSFSFIPYIWLPEIHGNVQVRRITASFDVDFDKVFDLIGSGDLFAAMGHFEAQRGRLSLFVDAVGGHVTPSGESPASRAKIDSTLNFTYVEFGPAYRILEMPSWVAGNRPLSIDALVGGRFMYFYSKLSVTGNRGFVSASDSTSFDWVDPFVGGRFKVPLVGDLDLLFRGDIGGFGAGSNLAWNIVTGFQYQLPWKVFSATTYAVAAYKVLDFDFESGSGTSRKAVSLNQRGPGLGISFNF